MGIGRELTGRGKSREKWIFPGAVGSALPKSAAPDRRIWTLEIPLFQGISQLESCKKNCMRRREEEQDSGILGLSFWKKKKREIFPKSLYLPGVFSLSALSLLPLSFCFPKNLSLLPGSSLGRIRVQRRLCLNSCSHRMNTNLAFAFLHSWVPPRWDKKGFRGSLFELRQNFVDLEALWSRCHINKIHVGFTARTFFFWLL